MGIVTDATRRQIIKSHAINYGRFPPYRIYILDLFQCWGILKIQFYVIVSSKRYSWYIVDVTHLPMDKMTTIYHTRYSKVFSWMKKWFSIQISLKFVPLGPTDKKSALVQVMAWRRTGNKPLPEPIPTQVTDTYVFGTRGGGGGGGGVNKSQMHSTVRSGKVDDLFLLLQWHDISDNDWCFTCWYRKRNCVIIASIEEPAPNESGPSSLP